MTEDPILPLYRRTSGATISQSQWSKPPKFLFFTMSAAFAVCILGLIGGMLYDLYAVFLRHRTLENVLGDSIPYYKTLRVGIVGMLLFLRCSSPS